MGSQTLEEKCKLTKHSERSYISYKIDNGLEVL